MTRIFTLADNYEGSHRFTRQAFTFPILLRILYGCGLRVGEVCSLQWKDVDLEQGVITILNAKNQKQRFVPMDSSLTKILKDYSEMVQREKICTDYLFESRFNLGKPVRVSSFFQWFIKILRKAGVEYSKSDPNERGPCPHCLRHTFAMKSFLKSENEGRRFEDTAPFLAAYLGHDGPKYTEAYLSSNHSLYTKSHQRINTAIGNLFPEVCFDEDER
jgi:integrase